MDCSWREVLRLLSPLKSLMDTEPGVVVLSPEVGLEILVLKMRVDQRTVQTKEFLRAQRMM